MAPPAVLLPWNISHFLFAPLHMHRTTRLSGEPQDKTGGAGSLDPYGKGASLLPFEIVYGVTVFLAFLLYSVVTGSEYIATVQKGEWMTRFFPLLSLAAMSVRLVFLLEFYNFNSMPFEYYFYLFCAGYGCTGCLALFAFLYWPSAAAYVQMEYRFVPLIDRSTMAPPGATKTCPERHVSIWKRLMFSWMNPLMKDGHERPLEDKDVWLLDTPDQSNTVETKFRENWEAEMRNGNPSLVRAIRKTFFWDILLGGFFKIFNDASQFIGPMILKQLILVARPDSKAPPYVGYVLAAGLFAGQIVGAFSECQYFQTVMRVGMHARSALVLTLFKRSTRLSPKGREGNDVGKISNLIGSDTEAIQTFCGGMYNLFSSPVRITVAIVLLYQELGPSAFVACVILVLAIPLQKKLVSLSTKMFIKSKKSTDDRVRLIGELMGAMDVVKCYAWEGSLETRVKGSRDEELVWIKKNKVIQAFNMFMITCIPIFVTFFTFLVYVALGNKLDAATAFTALSLFGVLRMPLITL